MNVRLYKSLLRFKESVGDTHCNENKWTVVLKKSLNNISLNQFYHLPLHGIDLDLDVADTGYFPIVQWYWLGNVVYY